MAGGVPASVGSYRLTTPDHRRRKIIRVNRPHVTPFDVRKIAAGTYAPQPDPIEWIVRPDFLDRPNLYPRQATFVKVIFLRDDLFTQFDHDVIGEWEQKFLSTGTEGISPGIMERIRINKANGRPWFRETQAVVGRRGSKGYTGALCGSRVLWHYMHRPGGPQEYYGIDRDKRITGIVFGSKKEQARDNQWRDINNVILGGPCFSPYISRPQTERLTIKCPNDWLRERRMEALGIHTEDDIASFEVVPAPSSITAARGPTSFMQFYDEQAHVVSSTANADAGEVYASATPALDQFKRDGFIYAPSSPWTKTGQFFENWELAIEMEPDGSPSYPERLMLQLPSWGLYEDWDEAHRIPLRPPDVRVIDVATPVKKRRVVNGRRRTVTVTEIKQVEQLVPDVLGTFKPLKGAIQAYDDDMRQLERANPDTFKVERRSLWAETLNAYMNSDKVAEVFAPWRDRTLYVQRSGILRETYSAHGDPSTSNKRFGWSIGHRVWVPDRDKDGNDTGDGWYHVVFDRIRFWDPADYEDHILDYDDVMGDIWTNEVKPFMPDDVSFDQFNVPATVGRLRKKVAKEQLPKAVHVHEVTRTAPLNWRHYEMFKASINMGWVHAPMFLDELDEYGEQKINEASSEAELELKFLEEKNGKVVHPETGPVQTKDIADTMCEVVVQLIGQQMAAFLGMEMDEISISGGAPMGTDPGRHTRTDNDVAERLGNLTGSGTTRGMGAPSRAGVAARGGVQRGMRRR